ncbi:MAG TPA: glycosyltransferase [Pseudonocardiaceae bacterium]|nr:glycosyltransferase [Pseudonocardiaceae bacterium]
MLKTNEGARWILPHIEELRGRGHDTLVMLPAGAGGLRSELTAVGVPTMDSPFDFRYRSVPAAVVGLVRVRRRLRQLAPDVLHYHLYSSALAGRLASIGLGMPRVHMVAGPLYLESPVIRTVERVLARLDTVIIGGSDFTSRRYLELGRPAAALPTIPYGVDTRFFRPGVRGTRAMDRGELGLAADDFVVVMVALVYGPKRAVHAGHGIKGHEVLLTAWAAFHAENPRSRLLLVGSGFDDAGERYRRHLVDRFGLARPDNDTGVRWIDTVPDVRPYYAAADVSVSPSLSDNHGAALEAAAMGVPSIVTDVGGLPETVDTASGWIVPAQDPEALGTALRVAWSEHMAGVLALRGRHARQLVRRRFARSSLVPRVADTIEEAAGRAENGPRVLSLFIEGRFLADIGGRWSPVDPANGASAWRGYLRDGNRLRLVARARTGPARPPDGLLGGGALVPLPYWVGPAELARRFVPFAVAVARAVADAEVIVLRLPGTAGSVGALACRVLRRRYAVEVVGDPVDVLRSGVLGAAGRLLARPAGAHLRRVVRGASASRFVTRQALQRRYPPRPGTPTAVTSNVQLRPEDYLPCGRRWRPGPFRVVAIGSHETGYKGHDVLLKAVRRLLDAGVDITVTIVGDGRAHGRLVAQSRSAKLGDRVEFLGTVACRQVIIDLLDSASLYVAPSRAEGLPRALIEAMARALPAVGSDIGGIPELLDAGCLVPVGDDKALADTIARLLSDTAEWETQSERNLAVAATYERSQLDMAQEVWLRRIPSARPDYRRFSSPAWRDESGGAG